MRSPLIYAALFTALVAMPLCAKTGAKGGHASTGVKGASSSHAASGGSVATAPGSGYHSSAGYGSAYGWGYNGWTKNGYKDGRWHGIPYSSPASQQPSAKRGNSSTSYASDSEMELIQQQVARHRTQQAQQHSQTPTPANSPNQP